MLRPYLHLSPLTEVFQDHVTMVPARLHISPHRRRDVSPCKVLWSPQNETLRCVPVASCPAGLLVIGLERRRWPPMENAPDVRFVDPHAKRARRDNHVYLIGEKRPEHPPANPSAEPGVVRSGTDARPEQRAGHQLRQTPGRRVDQRRSGRPANALADDGEPFAVVAHATDTKVE